MPRVGIRELKDRATEIMRSVRDEGAEYVVTYRGRPVAVLLPLEDDWLDAETRRAIAAASPGPDVQAELETLRREIGESWKSDKTAIELVAEQRR